MLVASMMSQIFWVRRFVSLRGGFSIHLSLPRKARFEHLHLTLGDLARQSVRYFLKPLMLVGNHASMCLAMHCFGNHAALLPFGCFVFRHQLASEILVLACAGSVSLPSTARTAGAHRLFVALVTGDPVQIETG